MRYPQKRKFLKQPNDLQPSVGMCEAFLKIEIFSRDVPLSDSSQKISYCPTLKGIS